MIRAWQMTIAAGAAGDRLIVIRGADFDRLVEKAGLRCRSSPRPPTAPPLIDFPPEVEDHLDTELIIP